MSKPDDIPQDAWDAAVEAFEVLAPGYDAFNVGLIEGVIASAIVAERKRAIEACEAQKRAFLSTEYAANQPIGSLLERFACDECIDAIRKGGE